jgi:hypothetical protein
MKYKLMVSHKLNTAVMPTIFARLNLPVIFNTSEITCNKINMINTIWVYRRCPSGSFFDMIKNRMAIMIDMTLSTRIR